VPQHESRPRTPPDHDDTPSALSSTRRAVSGSRTCGRSRGRPFGPIPDPGTFPDAFNNSRRRTPRKGSIHPRIGSESH
jgi:hypothetical protein